MASSIYLYVRAEISKEIFTDQSSPNLLSFQHCFVIADDEEHAYSKGPYGLPEVGSDKCLANDYVIKIGP